MDRTCARGRWRARREPGDVERDAAIAEALVASTKNQVEHRVVIDVVHDTLLPWQLPRLGARPSIVTVANVQHLGTRIEGRLRRRRRACSSWCGR